MTIVDELLVNSNLIAMLALGVSFLSIVIGFLSLWLQHRHNKLSVRPIGIILLSDYENRIAITVKNVGMGTMILKSFETCDNKGNKKDYPIDWMPPGIHWADFRKGLTAIKEGDSSVYLEYRPNPRDIDSEKNKEDIRSILKNLTIKITYDDIYRKKQPVLCRSLGCLEETIKR